MIPREVMIALAKLEREKRTLQDQFLTELETLTKDLEAKYTPRVRAINEALEHYRSLMGQHQSLSEELHWRIHDRDNHNTDFDTVKRMQKGFKRIEKARTKHAITGNR